MINVAPYTWRGAWGGAWITRIGLFLAVPPLFPSSRWMNKPVELEGTSFFSYLARLHITAIDRYKKSPESRSRRTSRFFMQNFFCIAWHRWRFELIPTRQHQHVRRYLLWSLRIPACFPIVIRASFFGFVISLFMIRCD